MSHSSYPSELNIKPEMLDWFKQSRFGMFIHWGLYSLAARIEWVKTTEKMTEAQYQRYFDHFDPDLYDPKEWARVAKAAGMKYVVITSKHHDGFCLWDSKYTDYKATNTPHGKDVLRPLLDALRAEGLKVGLYHSLIDWHHPDFTIDMVHPMREHPDALELNKQRNMDVYRTYLHNQVEELLTEYGKIDLMWFDFSYTDRNDPIYGIGKGRDDWHSVELMQLVRRLQPGILVNDRLDLRGLDGFTPDFATPEQYAPETAPSYNGQQLVWEACHTFSGGWGYFRDEESWKSPEQLIQLLVDCVSKDGNLLLNFGPNARGIFDKRAMVAAGAYSEWMRLNQRAIHGCTSSAFKTPVDCRLTQNGNRLYVHIFNWPFRHIHLEGLGGKIAYAQFLHDASEVYYFGELDGKAPEFTGPQSKGAVTLELPVKKPDVIVPVIEIFLKD